MFKTFLAILIIVIVAGGATTWYKTRGAAQPSQQQATTTVATTTDTQTGGTTGDTTPTASSGTINVAFGATGTLKGVSITPQEPINDSRCPQDVQCIWAGTVSVDARVQTASGSATSTFALNTPVAIGGVSITLIDATPYPSSGVNVTHELYSFTFKIEHK